MTGSGPPPTEPYDVGFVNVVPPRLHPRAHRAGQAVAAHLGRRGRPGPPCMVAGTQASGNGQVMVLPAAEVVRRLGLDRDQAVAVREGAAVVRGLPPTAVTAGRVTLARGTYVIDPRATEATDPGVKVTQQVEVPVIALPAAADTDARMLGSTLVLAADTPVTRGWPVRAQSITVRDPSGGAVSNVVAERLQEVFGDEVDVTVERGFTRDDAIIVAVLLGVFALLILVITLTSTALTLAEQQTDQATLAALGATRGTRRLMAASAASSSRRSAACSASRSGSCPASRSRGRSRAPAGPPRRRPRREDTILVIPWLSLLVVGGARPAGRRRDRLGRHPQGATDHPPHHLTPNFSPIPEPSPSHLNGWVRRWCPHRARKLMDGRRGGPVESSSATGSLVRRWRRVRRSSLRPTRAQTLEALDVPPCLLPPVVHPRRPPLRRRRLRRPPPAGHGPDGHPPAVAGTTGRTAPAAPRRVRSPWRTPWGRPSPAASPTASASDPWCWCSRCSAASGCSRSSRWPRPRSTPRWSWRWPPWPVPRCRRSVRWPQCAGARSPARRSTTSRT